MASSVYDTTQSPYTNQAADQAELDRQNKLDVATLNAITKVSSGSAPAAASPTTNPGAAAAPAPTPQQMGVQPSAVAGSMQSALASYAPTQGQVPEGIQDFVSFGNNPIEAALRTKAESANLDQLNNPGAAFDQGAQASRENLDISQRNAREQTRDDLARTYGGNASQVSTALRDADQQAILDRRGLNSDLATGRANAVQQTTAQAIQNALGFTQIGSNERIAASNQAEQKRQFDTSLLANMTEADKQRAWQSTEAATGRAFTTEERQAVQDFQAAQAKGAQDWQSAEAALGRTFTTEERQAIQDYQTSERKQTQIYNSAEAALGRQYSTSERQAVQDYQTAERLGAQDFQSAEAALGRTFSTSEREAIQAYQTSERLSTQDFSQMMTEKGYVHDTDLEIMRDNLQKELQANGISADQAKQQADEKFQELTQERDQTFQASQADLNRKFTTGERIDTQDFQKSIQANEFRQQDSLSQLQALTQTAIAQGGWDNAQKLQAQDLLAQAAEAEKNRSAQYLMFTATQAQQDSQFAQEFGLKKEEVQANIENSKQQLGIALQQLGISQDQWNTQKDDAAFNKALELAQYGVSLWNGDNEEALQPFVTKLAQTLGQGLGLDPSTLSQAIDSSLSNGTTGTKNPDGSVTQTPAQAYAAFDKIIDTKAGNVTPEAAEAVKTYAKAVANKYASAPAGKMLSSVQNTVSGSDIDLAASNLRAAGMSQATLNKLVDKNKVGDFSTHSDYDATPEFVNYTLYTRLLSSGVSKADAKQSLALLVGQDKADAALALEGQK